MTDTASGQVEIVVAGHGAAVRERASHCLAPLGLAIVGIEGLRPLLDLAPAPRLAVVSLEGLAGEEIVQAAHHLRDAATVWIAPPGPGHEAAHLAPLGHLLPHDFTCSEMRAAVAQMATLLRTRSEPSGTGSPDTLIVRAPAMKQLVAEVDAFAGADQNVLIQGETGTGKELIAKRLHLGHGRYGRGPFIPVNCGAVPEGLFESLFFGHEKGAFSGATHAHKGYLEQAKGGTLFLDEVGDLPRLQQVKLLRVLESNSVTPVGAVGAVALDFRLVAASNLSLRELVERGAFRADLFYRLAVIELRVPNLEERGAQDKVAIFRAIAQQVIGAQALATAGPAPFWVTDAVAGMVFPGNVRQLRNLAERVGVAVRQTGRWDTAFVRRALEQARGADAPGEAAFAPRRNWNHDERNRIIAALQAHAWKRQETAAELGISRKVLWEKMRKYQISDGEPLGPGHAW